MDLLMLAMSTIYSITGLSVSVYLYGRKTDHLEEYWKEKEEENDSD